MPGQRRFQVIELFRQDTFHQISGDGLLASMVADVQRERQVQLNLQRGAELGGQQVDCVRGQNGGVNRTKVRKVSQDFSIISYINMLGDWQLLGFVAFPSTFGGHIFFATHCQIWHLKSCETLRTFVRFTPLIVNNTSSRCHVSPGLGCRCRISFAYDWPNLRHHFRMASYVTMMPRANRSSSTSR